MQKMEVEGDAVRKRRLLQRFVQIVQGAVPMTDFERALQTFVRETQEAAQPLLAPYVPGGPEWRVILYAYVLFAPESVKYRWNWKFSEWDDLIDVEQLPRGIDLTAQFYYTLIADALWSDDMSPYFEAVFTYAIQQGWNICVAPYRDFGQLFRHAPRFSLTFARLLVEQLRRCVVAEADVYEALNNAISNINFKDGPTFLPPSLNDLRLQHAQALEWLFEWQIQTWIQNATNQYQRFKPRVEGSTLEEEELVQFPTPRRLTAAEFEERRRFAQHQIGLLQEDLRDLRNDIAKAREREQVFDLLLESIAEFVQARPSVMQQYEVRQELALQPARGGHPGGAEYHRQRREFTRRGGRDIVQRLEDLTYDTHPREIERLLTDLGIQQRFTDVIDAVNYLKEYLSQLE